MEKATRTPTAIVMTAMLISGCTTPTDDVTGATITQGPINFGTNDSAWANDGECDDPRFEGPGADELLALAAVLAVTPVHAAIRGPDGRAQGTAATDNLRFFHSLETAPHARGYAHGKAGEYLTSRDRPARARGKRRTMLSFIGTSGPPRTRAGKTAQGRRSRPREGRAMQATTSELKKGTPAEVAAHGVLRGTAGGLAAGMVLATVGFVLDGAAGAGGAAYWYYLAGLDEAPMLTMLRITTAGSGLFLAPVGHYWPQWIHPVSTVWSFVLGPAAVTVIYGVTRVIADLGREAGKFI